MNKEIKFRHWLPELDEETGIFKDNYSMYYEAYKHQWLGPHSMQYTGLKDKNGKEIYESDIVEYKFEMEKSKKKYKTVIKDLDLIFGFREFLYDEYSNYNVNLDSLEIIGNIYETPELLEDTNFKRGRL